jgi:DNA-binding transcriptional ArsR family regulator
MIQILRCKGHGKKLTIQNLVEAIERSAILLYDQTEALYHLSVTYALKVELEDILQGPR